jgi:hypothetical protein
MTSVATGIGPATRNETVVLSTKISDVYHAPTKKGPGDAEALSLFRSDQA